MEEESLIKRIQSFSDLELAVLICFVAREHCIINTVPDCLDDLTHELSLIASKNFGFHSVVFDCSENTTSTEFYDLLLSHELSSPRSSLPTVKRHDEFLREKTSLATGSQPHGNDNPTKTTSIPNLIIARNFNHTSQQVQSEALELMRTRHVASRESTHHAPEHFLFIALLSGRNEPRLTKHLNDYMFISHVHNPDDGFSHVTESSDCDSFSSVVRRNLNFRASGEVFTPTISSQEFLDLIELSSTVTMSIEVKRYQMNIISFLRLHRAVGSGISAAATKHFEKLARCLAPLHDLSYVTPALVALAAKKVYLHRIQVVDPENERSMQWGSDIEAVSKLLKGLNPEEILEEVLVESGIETPL